MKENELIHGFRFERAREIPELDGVLREATYEKNGAKLIFIDREDNNKTFAIAFKTIPEDSTGVFHIIEHSVLCGSDKYPVKEPFVELLKGSVKTFLNAFTFPDKTMYPVSSRNDKDFLNLVDVYMDAVLHPVAMTKPEIFRQEGWHYELHRGEDAMSYKGVVFNEMKGAYSSADEVMMQTMASLLYKGSTYALDSGGDPTVITNLTYEEFVASHKKYYHPSNARIILDGSVDLDKTLELLDSFLSEYDKLDIDAQMPLLLPAGYTERTVEYEISPAEDPQGKARVCLGFMASDFSERRRNVALSLLGDVLAGSNEAPFKKAMLDSGICEDSNFIPYDGIAQNSLLIEIKNVATERMAEAKELALGVIRDIVNNGIDKKLLRATFNSLEFRIREQDMATFPAGIAYAISALDTWLYDGDPMCGLAFEEDLAFLREALEGDYYEKLLQSVILDSKHSATLYMTPSKTLGEERAEAERARLAEAYEKMTREEREEVIRVTEALEAWQASADTPEALATLPKLLISDIEKEPERYNSEIYNIGNTEALYTKAQSRGITYTNLLFDISDFNEDELFTVSMLCELYKNVPTERGDALQLQTKIKSELGSFSLSPIIATRGGRAHAYVNVAISALNSKLDAAVSIAEEVLLGSRFDDTSIIGKLVKQSRNDDAEAICASGHLVALNRSMAYVSAEGAIGEYLSGIECYLKKKDLDTNFASRKDGFCNKAAEVAKRAFVRARLKVSHAGERNDEYLKKFVAIFPEGELCERQSPISAFGKRREGIVIPASIAFAASAASPDGALGGSFGVVRSILSYGYLWNNIRVQGGAYGAGFIARRTNSSLGYYTYRDPSPARSVKTFSGSSEFLRKTAEAGEDITGFIIGAVGDSDPLLTPKVVNSLSVSAYLRGEQYEDRRKFRAEMLSTSKSELLAAADILDCAFEKAGVCIVGGKDKLDECEIDALIEI